MSETYDFPVYRKYPNDKHFFKILSKSEFEEITIMGRFYSTHHKIASILPDRNMILDMLEMREGHWIKSTAQEYDAMMEECKLKRTFF